VTFPSTTSIDEILISNPKQWIDLGVWNDAKYHPGKIKRDEHQELILDRGHWRDDTIRQENR
jgi:hypothetical protein